MSGCILYIYGIVATSFNCVYLENGKQSMLQPIHFWKDLEKIFPKMYVTLIVYRFRDNRQKHQHRRLNFYRGKCFHTRSASTLVTKRISSIYMGNFEAGERLLNMKLLNFGHKLIKSKKLGLTKF